jgi:hypothetical protein
MRSKLCLSLFATAFQAVAQDRARHVNEGVPLPYVGVPDLGDDLDGLDAVNRKTSVVKNVVDRNRDAFNPFGGAIVSRGDKGFLTLSVWSD